MKKYMINVNGNSYEVGVEEIKDGGLASNPSKVEVSIPKPVAKAPISKPVQATPKKEAEPSSVAGAGGDIICPMPGTITKVNVKPGDTVKKGDILLILEAMKMENEIFAAQDG